MSSLRFEEAGVDTLYGDKHVCSACWEELKQKGFSIDGNWAPGAITEYLKNTPNAIAILISVGALVVSIVALVRGI